MICIIFELSSMSVYYVQCVMRICTVYQILSNIICQWEISYYFVLLDKLFQKRLKEEFSKI